MTWCHKIICQESAYEHIEFVAAVCGDDIYSCTCGVWYITRWARRAAWNGQTQWASQCFWVWENSRQTDRQDEFRSLIPPDQEFQNSNWRIQMRFVCWDDFLMILPGKSYDELVLVCYWPRCLSVQNVECRTMHPCLRQSADFAERSSTRIEWMHCISECSQNV